MIIELDAQSPLRLTQNILNQITTFYNNHFTYSSHRVEYKLERYRDKTRKPIVILVKKEGTIIAILESWLDKHNPDKRMLVTILIDKKYRKQGLAQKMFQKLEELSEQKTNFIVHFRDQNRDWLEKFYNRLGFKNIIQIGHYKNNEIKWRMEK